MNPADWKKVKEIFNEAVDLPKAQRALFFEENYGGNGEFRAEVEKMLKAIDEESLLLNEPIFDFKDFEQSQTPEKIGDYKILREIGRGGMGAVYEAVRETSDFKQRVALKIIKRGMDTDAILSRFRHEQKILASLEHPFIARFLDGGMTADGLPFYAMEYVEGEFIDDYCAANNLSIDEKLKLFREVCTALQYAHQNLVVHRDLKPKNILVTADGTPKLLDFGIGKILTPEADEEIGTATQFGMMTPAYASPEQILGKRIGTASDIYSLGVILYELLTGQKPYEFNSKSQIEVEKAVLETEPPRPSAISNSRFRISNSEANEPNPKFKIQNLKSLKGDLDTIILKALRKETAERYVSVGQFSEDIRRYLEGIPIWARPHTFSYRAAKFIRRNRAGVIAASLVFLSLCAGITVAFWQASEARQAKIRAEHRFNEVRELANNVIFKYHDAIAELPGSTATREMLVRDATRYLDNLAKESAGNPELQRELARAYLKLGDVQGKAYSANIGDTAGATESYRKAVALLETVVEADKNNTEAKFELGTAYDALFAIYMRNGDSELASVLEKALNLQDELLAAAPDNEDYKLQKARTLVRKADSTATFDDKLPIYREALSIAENLSQNSDQDNEKLKFVMRLNQRLGSTYIWLGDKAVKENAGGAEFYAGALPFHEKSVGLAEKLYNSDRENLYNQRSFAAAATNLGETLAKNGKHAEALTKMQIALKIFEEILAKDPRNLEAKFDVATCFDIRAQLHLALGDKRAAIEYFQKALALNSEIRQADQGNNETARAIQAQNQQLAKIYKELGDTEKAAFYGRNVLK